MAIEEIKKALKKAFPTAVLEMELNERGILTLTGECSEWKEVVAVGHKAAKQKGVKNVVNKLSVPGLKIPKKDYSELRAMGENAGLIDDVDVVIIGAGISGCGIARELSKYRLNILVVEMSDDVATGATKANNGNIHPGYAVKPGTLKAKLNVEGNRMYTKWAEDLGFDLQRCGAMGFVTSNILKPALRVVYKKAVKNGVDGVELVNGKRACELEPGLNQNGLGKDVKLALWLPSMGLVEPYQVAVALAENAASNGVHFRFNCTVADVLVENGKVGGIVTDKGTIKAKYIINCAGVYADEISAMANDECYTIHARKGVIAILDKAKKPEYEALCEHISFETVKLTIKNMNAETKGGGMCHTPEQNILMGPSAKEIPDKEDRSTSAQELSYAMGRGDGNVGYGDIIRFFAGVRPADYKEDFFIEMSPVTNGFINVGAIQSPGLASAPAIAKMVEEIVNKDAKEKGNSLERKNDWQPIRKEKPAFRNMSREEQDKLIKKDASYGKIVCRCESITEGEILDAIHSPVPPASIDAIKRRTRAGMGRCQGGFCQPRVLEILAREQGKNWIDITLNGEGTNVLLKENRRQLYSEEVAK
ncbi:MAG: NAD(P)/FAD-dependent oxidoreductase [Oscillospiraceae bacterium]